MSFNYDANKTYFHNKGFALSLVLKVRFFGTRKWPIGAKSTTSEARKKKEQRKKGEKAEARNLLKQKKKSMPYFLFPGRSPPCRGL